MVEMGLFASLRGYRWSWLPQDAVAGLMLLAIAIPGQLATARLAGMPPESGLYAFIAGSVAFAAFGANRFMSVAADSTIAPIFAGMLSVMAASDPGRYGNLAAVFALLVGLILLIAGVARAGWIADLLSVPVMTGFLAGIAVHIVVGQLPGILGVEVKADHVLAQLVDILRRLSDSNWYTTSIGLGVLGVTFLSSRLSAKIPGALIALLGATLAVWQFGLRRHGVDVLGALQSALPSISLPDVTLTDALHLFPLALIVALVCMMQTSAVARSFPSDPNIEENISRDFTGVGIGNLLASVTGAFPVDASPPSTAIVAQSGGRSQLAAMTAVISIIGLVAVAGGAFAYVPVAGLDGVLVYIGIRICRLNVMLQVWRRGGYEILLLVASAALVVILPIETGVGLSVVLSLLHTIYVVARPGCAELTRIPGTTVWWVPAEGMVGEKEPGVLVFSPGAPLNFTNATFVRRKLLQAVDAMAEPCRLVVIEANGIIDVDFTGSQVLQDVMSELRRRNIDVAMARLESIRAQHTVARTGLITVLGEDHLFRSVDDAVRTLSRRSN
jgi:MFS superfamily sulfate permease-like transporter